MKVVLINGSPHEKGCTYTALKEVADTLQNEGVDAEIVHIGKDPIAGCTACGYCSRTGENRCVINDRVNQILEKLETADGLVVGSPVYYASPNGSLISLLDRLFLAGAQSIMALKPGAAVTSARRAGTTSTLEVIQKYFTISQMPVVSSNYWPMVHGSSPQEVAQDKEGLQIMRILGRNMAWMLSCIQAGEKAGVKKPQAEEKIKTSFIR